MFSTALCWSASHKPTVRAVFRFMKKRMGSNDMDIETVLDWQQRGINARILGLARDDCPQRRALDPKRDAHALSKADAWNFGWAIEDASRRAD